ncbi:aldose 1-epimerase [Mycolicibacterium phlei]
MSDLEAITLTDPASTMTATFIPGAGMLGTSLRDGDAEFLGQRRGLDAYLTDGKTMGIPILYPWANRLSGNDYRVGDAAVTLSPGTGGVRTDANGAPIHGTLTAYPGWAVTERTDNSLTATVDFAGSPALLAAFPFPHLLTQRVTLLDRTLTVATTVTATAAAAVPLCFGYHPYLTIPGVPRGQWTLTTPAMRHLPVDGRGIPTGAQEPWPARSVPLGDITYDDGFDGVPDGAVFTVAADGRRIDVTFDTGYPAAQLFAPGDDLIAIEPMAAPTDALRRGGYRTAVPGTPQTARFSVTVT